MTMTRDCARDRDQPHGPHDHRHGRPAQDDGCVIETEDSDDLLELLLLDS